ncbi:MAG: hypothetical protein M3Q15_04770 [Pseudomonadota bacterium]|nr:hypothetical protein [Pseudomonadota bacterium]
MKTRLIATFAAALFAVPAAAAEPLSEAVSGDWLVATFKSLCFDPFGDRAKLTRAIAQSDAAFTSVTDDPTLPVPGLSKWQSTKATLAYTDGALLPKPLPSPQCSLTGTPAADYDHAATASALAGAVGLLPAKPKGKNGRFSSEWNFAGPKGEKRRLFLSQESTPGGASVRISLLNLR